MDINDSKNQKNEFNSNFNLFKEISGKRFKSFSKSNFRKSLPIIKKDNEDKNSINKEKNKIESDNVQNNFKSSNKNKKHETINLKNKNHFSFDISKKNDNKNVTYIKKRRSSNNPIKIDKFFKNLSKRKTITKKSTINKNFLLKIEKRKSNKFLEKLNGK